MKQDNNHFIEALSKNSFFSELTSDEVQILASCAQEVDLNEGEIIIHDAVIQDFFYLILEGEFKITKTVNKKDYTLSYLKEGDIMGELSILDDFARTTNAIATKKSKVLEFDIDKIRSNKEFFETYFKITKEVSKSIAIKLTHANDFKIKALEEKSSLARFSISILYIGTICSIFISLSDSARQNSPSSTYCSAVLILLLFVVVLNMIRKSTKPLKDFGFTLENAKSNIYSSILYSLPLILVAVFLKYCAITYISSLEKFPLFDITATFGKNSNFSYINYVCSIIIYILLCPIQVISTQSGIQKALEFVLEKLDRAEMPGVAQKFSWRVIFFTSFLFMLPHIYMGYFFAVATFVPSLLWCWLFYKQKSIVGPIVSHILIGAFVIFILGFENLV